MAKNRSVPKPIPARAAARKTSAPPLVLDAPAALKDPYRQIVESASIGFVAIGRDGVIEMVNTQVERLFGYRREELIGQPIEVLVPPRFRTNHPSHRTGFFGDPRARSIGAGRDLAGLRKDGSEFPIEIGLNSIATDDGILGVAAVVDITDRKRLDVELAGRKAAVNKSMAIVEFDMDGTILTANGNFLRPMGYTLDDVKGRHHSMFVDEAYRDSADYREFWAKLRRGEHHSGEYRRVGKGGREVWMQASYTPILDLEDRPIKVVKYATDVTAQVRLRKELEGVMQKVTDNAQALASASEELTSVSQQMASSSEETRPRPTWWRRPASR